MKGISAVQRDMQLWNKQLDTNARLNMERSALVEALEAVLPYAEARAEDLWDLKDFGKEDPTYPGALEASAAVTSGYNLLRRLTGKNYEGYPS